MRIDLTSSAGHLDSLWLKLSGAVDPGAPTGRPALLSRVRVVVLKPPLSLPNLPIASLLILTPVLAYIFRASFRPAWAFSYGLAVLCALTVLTEAIAWTQTDDPLRWWELVITSQDRDLYFLVPYGLLLALMGWHRQVWRASPGQEKVWTLFALAGILAWGGSHRLGALIQVGWTHLEPDAIQYRQLAEAMDWPYDTGPREPLWIWMVKGWIWLGGSSDFSMKLLTVLISLMLLCVAYKVFQDYTGKPLVGLLVSALLSVNPYLVSLSVRALRDEAYAIAVLTFIYFVLVRRMDLSLLGRTIGVALSGASTQLLRFNSCLFVVPLLIVWARRHPVHL